MVKYQSYILIDDFLLHTRKSLVTDSTYTYIYKKDYNRNNFSTSCSLCDVNQGDRCTLCTQLSRGKSSSKLYSVLSYGAHHFSASLYFRSIGSLYSSKVVKSRIHLS